MTDNELKVIRQNIACPQFGDNHYGAWGALSIDQRKAIYRMWDEINRQKAEIERLTEEIELLHSDYTYKLVKNKAKAGAIKEFAERLKEKVRMNCFCEKFVFEKDIDNLVKEMVGDA